MLNLSNITIRNEASAGQNDADTKAFIARRAAEAHEKWLDEPVTRRDLMQLIAAIEEDDEMPYHIYSMEIQDRYMGSDYCDDERYLVLLANDGTRLEVRVRDLLAGHDPAGGAVAEA